MEVLPAGSSTRIQVSLKVKSKQTSTKLENAYTTYEYEKKFI